MRRLEVRPTSVFCFIAKNKKTCRHVPITGHADTFFSGRNMAAAVMSVVISRTIVGPLRVFPLSLHEHLCRLTFGIDDVESGRQCGCVYAALTAYDL